MVSNTPKSGQIITFYSYKGGTGRSMALANVACLLSEKLENGKSDNKVLMIDWDLEAPGLHQYFNGRFSGTQGNKRAIPDDQLGLIDLFYEIKNRLDNQDFDGELTEMIFEDINVENYIIDTTIPSLQLMPAGKYDEMYSAHVNAFDWKEFFDKFPDAIFSFAEYLRKKYRYVLIDSRTGYTDISGICTSLMPEKLVVVFTPNRQSMIGVIELVYDATEYRKQSDDLRPLVVFPLASRIENAESELRFEWRFGVPESSDIIGYQPMFETALREAYKLPKCDLTDYFDDVKIQYEPRYSYGEGIAVLTERKEDRLSIARSYENFTERLIRPENPWNNVEQEKDIAGKKAIEGTCKVLVVYDEIDVRNLLAGVLSDAGCFVKTVGSEQEALVSLVEGTFHFIVIDIQLIEHEDVRGLKLAETIRENGIRSKIIFVTGETVKATHFASALMYGVIGYIEKKGDWINAVRETIEINQQPNEANNLEFDVFLCHNSVDKQAVKVIGEKLKAQNIRPWLDEWELQPGMPWQRIIEAQIRDIKSVAVFVGESGIGPWQAMEIRGLLSEFVDENKPVIPVILENAPKMPKLPLFLREMSWVDFRHKDPDPMKQLIWGITGRR